MNLSKLLYSSLTFVMGLFFVVIGIVGLLALWFQHIRTSLVVFMLENAVMISIFSLGLLAIGMAVLIHVFQSTKHHYYKIECGRHLASVDEGLIHDYLNSYWNELFPKFGVPTKVTLKNNKISINADLPYYPIEGQKTLLGKVDKDISKILAKIFGYNREFSLQIRFNELNETNQSS